MLPGQEEAAGFHGGVGRSPVPTVGAEEPSAGARAGARLAGWQAEAVSIPSRVQALGAGSAGEVIFFLFFSPPGQLIPSIFNELAQVAQ